MERKTSNDQRVLIIDDDPVTCKILVHSLKKRGYVPVSFNNGGQAIKACQDEYYNIALIDLVLPDIPGIEVMQKIKEISSYTEPIIITGNASLDTAVQAMQDGAFSYVVKPIDMKYLFAVISKSLEKQKSQIEHERSEAEKKKLEEQLFHAEKMKAIGTLAGGSAHDYNNVLMVIQEAVSLMSSDINSDHPHYEYLRTIEKQVKKGAEITRQLLGFARGGKYEAKAININRLVKESSHMFSHTKKQVRIHENYQKALWPVEVDHGQIEQVLLNLYVNAGHAMPRGGDLFLETRNERIDEEYANTYNVAPGDYVRISVRDTGSGMDEVIMQRIFEPFFSTKKKGIGTGLGLASAYGIIKNHNGFIKVYSEINVGTLFNIYLPRLHGVEVPDEKSQEREDRACKVLKGSETIVLVDDDSSLRKLGGKILEKLGYKSIVADSGEEALEILKAHQDTIDLVVLDMIMPDMSGEETYKRLKKINPDVKVLLSSGYSESGMADEMLRIGCNGFIQKPFNMDEFSIKIREMLDKN